MTAFFSSWALLSVNPSDIPSRQGVITAARNLATTFNSAAKNLTALRGNLNQQVPGDIQQINTMAKSVAGLNLQIANARNSGQNSGTLEDQRNSVIQNMSQLVGVSVTNGNNGQISLSTGQGSALVVEGQSFALQAQSDPVSGMTHIISNGNDITSQITGGQLGGTLQVRDQEIPGLQTQLDTLASGIAAAVNTAHQAGTDLNGAPGQVFFNVPATTAGTAATMSVNISDPALIAAGQSGASGDNANALVLSGLQNQNIVAGQSANSYYINTVSQLGNDISSAQTSNDAQTAVLQQLKTQQSSVSGVSLDEEAAHLVQFQRAYQAAARVITIVDQLTSVAINMGAP
jgi:flagellar hook-associated protein 1 FlgK